MKEWKICFFEAWEKPEDDGNTFGASVSYCLPSREDVRLAGEVFCGSYENVLDNLKQYAGRQKSGGNAAIILFVENQGQENFMERFRQIFPDCNCAGGTAAAAEGSSPCVYPACEDVAVMMIGQTVKVETINFHTGLETVDIRLSKGDISEINGKAPRDFLQSVADVRNGGKWSLEQITLSDLNGKNIHFDSCVNGLHPNAKLSSEEKAQIRYLDLERFRDEFRHFVQTDNSILFGCAGLKSIIDFDFKIGKNSLIGFFWGEVVTLGEPCFANLMMSKIVLQ